MTPIPAKVLNPADEAIAPTGAEDRAYLVGVMTRISGPVLEALSEIFPYVTGTNTVRIAPAPRHLHAPSLEWLLGLNSVLTPRRKAKCGKDLVSWPENR